MPTPLNLNADKVFCIGQHKTGTVSLHNLFLELGLVSRHLGDWTKMDDYHFDETQCLLDGGFQNPYFWEDEIDNCKFIVTVRDFEDWVLSMLNWIGASKRFANKGGKNHERYGVDWDVTQYTVSRLLLSRNSDHLQCLKYLEKYPSKILIVNYIKDPYAIGKVCNFLGLENEIFTKRHDNSGPNPTPINRAYYKGLLDRALRDLGVWDNHSSNDLLVPTRYDNFDRYSLTTGEL